MRSIALFSAAAVALAAPHMVRAQTPSAPTMQQAFDAAQALFDKQRFAEADAAFGAIEARLLAGPHPNARTLAVARLRRAQALAQTGETARATALLLERARWSAQSPLSA